MLTIQRASAGSGKTYTLAKKFILNIIAFKTENGKWRIRNERQIEDAVTHILAITFTNKATNEMKQRIVNNLSLLSKASIEKVDKNFLKETPYLQEFHELTGASYSEIGNASKSALKIILNNYSQFKISTIDSFFQEILRTFTYEANINDSYQLEIDSTFVTESAIDAAINELDIHPAHMGNASFWLKTLISEKSKISQKWNPFNKKANRDSVYYNIREALKQLEKEDFKEVKQQLDDYFADPQNAHSLPLIYNALKNEATKERVRLLDAIKSRLSRIEELIEYNQYTEKELLDYFLKHLSIIKSLRLTDTFGKGYESVFTKGSVLKKKFRTENNPLDHEVIQMYRLISEWDNPPQGSFHKNWMIYGPLLPYLGLIIEVRTFLTDVLEINNLIQLSDTGYILKKIIGNDDAPFVYERLGNKIDHYLIDEFQDTSRLQWDILFPLLNEGVAKNLESLIIGDPKQSIYRFRNADHKLITEVVPDLFPHDIRGLSSKENTNWRSHTNIVKFNNYFFTNLSHIISELSLKNGGNYDFEKLYSNVIQKPNNEEGLGYVEVRTFAKPSSEDIEIDDFETDDENRKDNWFNTLVLNHIPVLVQSLIKRGYRQKDIGILVNRNSQGKEVIDKLISYNENLPEGFSKIDFISEESLLVSSSPAVGVILGVLQKLAQPALFIKETHSEDVTKRRYLDWNTLKISYNIYSNQHPDIPPAQRIMKFLNETGFDESIPSLLKDLPSPSLTSIVEVIVKSLLDRKLKKSDAIYITSFQDIINEYSGSHTQDPASFLEWWKSRGKDITISSPEGLDAVQIMTVHKSKGLEFKCVILPFVTEVFTPKKSEWRWVKPNSLKDIQLPPFLPVISDKRLIGSSHETIYKEYYDQVLTDKINMNYVAFTRARNELYILTKEDSNKNSPLISNYLNRILKGIISKKEDSNDCDSLLMDIGDIVIDEESGILTYGEPLSHEEIKEEYSKEDRKKSKEISPLKHEFNDYYVNSKRPRLRSVSSILSPSGEFN